MISPCSLSLIPLVDVKSVVLNFMKVFVLLDYSSEKHVSILCWTIAAVQSLEGLYVVSFTGTGALNLTLHDWPPVCLSRCSFWTSFAFLL